MIKRLLAKFGPKAIFLLWRYKFYDGMIARLIVKRLRKHKRIWLMVVDFTKGDERKRIRYHIDVLDGEKDRLIHLFDAVMKRVERVGL